MLRQITSSKVALYNAEALARPRLKGTFQRVHNRAQPLGDMPTASGTQYDCDIECLKGPWCDVSYGIRHLRCHAFAWLGCLCDPPSNDEAGQRRLASDYSLFHSVLYLWRMAAHTSHGLALGVVRNGIDRSALPALDRTSADRRYVLASTLSTNSVRISSMRFSSKRRVYLFCNCRCTSMADLSRRRQMSTIWDTYDNSGCQV